MIKLRSSMRVTLKYLRQSYIYRGEANDFTLGCLSCRDKIGPRQATLDLEETYKIISYLRDVHHSAYGVPSSCLVRNTIMPRC
jgi:hypothetical protein